MIIYTYYSTLNKIGKEGIPGKASWSVPKTLTMQTQHDPLNQQGEVESM